MADNRSDGPARAAVPAWLDEVVSAQRKLQIELHQKSESRRVSGRAGPPSAPRQAAAPGTATVVHSAAPQPLLPSPAPGLIDLMRVGTEPPGRYTYLSPDGERGAELGRGRPAATRISRRTESGGPSWGAAASGGCCWRWINTWGARWRSRSCCKRARVRAPIRS